MSSIANVETHLDVVEKLVSNGFNHLEVKENYIFPPHECPQMAEVSHSYSIPVIDLKDLESPGRKSVVNEIKRACEDDGFFQIVNHGVPKTLMKSMMDVAKEFFEMPLEDRACLCSEDTRQLVRLSTSFNITKDKFLNWMDFLTQSCHPLEEFIHAWPQKPAAYRKEIAGEYAKEIRALSLKLLAAISEAMGQDSDYLNTIFKKHRQVLSNGRFQSVEHRAVTNNTTVRISIPTFYGPSVDAFISPAESMVDEEHPALYRGYRYEEYFQAFRSQGLKSKSVLDRFKIEAGQ